MEIGQAVTYVDTVRKERPALVTAVHGSGDTPSINVVFVNNDETQRDDYGRKIERASSVSHQSSQQAPGRYWK